jgi:hypothetical protein
MTTCRRCIAVLLACLAGALAGGCVAPGSAMTQVELRGQLLDESGAPMAYRPLQVCLPAAYGLRGLDAAWGEPADYGHRDQWAQLTTDAEGRFVHRFEPMTYSMMYWLLPPLGAGKPPKPVVGLRSRLASGEWFLVYLDGNKSRAVRWREGTSERTPVPGGTTAPVVTYRKGTRDDPHGWTSDVTITRPG